MHAQSRSQSNTSRKRENSIQSIQSQKNQMVTLAEDREDEVEETEEREYAREEGEVDLWWRTAEGLLVDEGAGEGEGYDCEEELNAS